MQLGVISFLQRAVGKWIIFWVIGHRDVASLGGFLSRNKVTMLYDYDYWAYLYFEFAL